VRGRQGQREREDDERADDEGAGRPSDAAERAARSRRLARSAQRRDGRGDQGQAAQRGDGARRLARADTGDHQAQQVGTAERARNGQSQDPAPGGTRATAQPRVDRDCQSRERSDRGDAGDRCRRAGKRRDHQMHRQGDHPGGVQATLVCPGRRPLGASPILGG